MEFNLATALDSNSKKPAGTGQVRDPWHGPSKAQCPPEAGAPRKPRHGNGSSSDSSSSSSSSSSSDSDAEGKCHAAGAKQHEATPGQAKKLKVKKKKEEKKDKKEKKEKKEKGNKSPH
ncbi:hypothetical protein H1C71_039016 [Ictidomys tridecemlineatus]|uniref:Chromosome 19 open reading frame 33 n=1 Tax=Ictidomys tridecemlineatus TaxID=43179 RepID=A0A287CTX8_ICTTR|nr:immortalization up-regulated protein [Ictidomys tridecemlineatus]KAG3255964.1 hypothetical protein H1C71_039016 [Ictidomys tridecemlineatus]